MVIIYETHSLVNIQTVNMSTPKKRKVLSLDERMQAIQLLKSGKSSHSVAERNGCLTNPNSAHQQEKSRNYERLRGKRKSREEKTMPKNRE